MFASLYMTLLAFVVAMVSAQTAISGTTTSTVSMTQTITLTRCNPTVTNCPAARHNTTTSTFYPASNTSTVAWPTTYANKTTKASHVASTGGFKSTSVALTYAPTTIVVATTAPAASAATSAPAATTSAPVVASGAQALFIQSGLLLGGLAGAIALLA